MLISTIKIQKNRHIAKHFHLLCADLFMNPVYKGTFSVPSTAARAFLFAAKACAGSIFAAKACAGTKIIATCKLKKLKRLPG